MTCIHGNMSEDDSWGGCIHCAEEERNRKFYEEHNPPKYYDPPEPKFNYDPYFYHMRLCNVPVISIGNQFTTIIYEGIPLDIPNKIIKYKGKKRKLYVHKRIFLDILSINNLI